MKLDEPLYAAVYKETDEILSFPEGDAIGDMAQVDFVVDIVVNTLKQATMDEIKIVPVKISITDEW